MLEVSILSVLQGVAEFLPISSSGHLVIGKSLLGLGDAGMRLDIFLHVGTLLSIFVFYFAVIRRILAKREWMYVAKILVSAIPVGVVGLLFKERLEEVFSSPSFVGGALIATGIVPGVSRSGTTLAAARAAKVDGEKAAEFSFLMSAPPIAGAAVLELVKSMRHGGAAEAQTSWGLCIFGAVLAAVVGWFALKLLVASLKGRWFWLFGPYCMAAGLAVLFFVS